MQLLRKQFYLKGSTLSSYLWYSLSYRIFLRQNCCSQRASQVTQIVKNLPAMQKTQVWSLGREDPLEKDIATHGEFHGQRNLAGYNPWDHKDTIERLALSLSHCSQRNTKGTCCRDLFSSLIRESAECTKQLEKESPKWTI